MLIGVKKRFVFVANSKTASTSIEFALAPHAEIMRGGTPASKHIPLTDIRKEYHFLFDRAQYPFESFFRFGVMRDPLDWIKSWYRYRRGNAVETPLAPDMSFDAFWDRNDWNISRASGVPFDQSVRFLDDQDQPLADLIIPHGRLDHFFPKIAKAIGVPAALPKRNVSRIKRLDTPVSETTLKKVREHYARDYALIDQMYEINQRGLEKLADLSNSR